MRMPSPAQRAPCEQAVGSECTGYSCVAPKRNLQDSKKPLAHARGSETAHLSEGTYRAATVGERVLHRLPEKLWVGHRCEIQFGHGLTPLPHSRPNFTTNEIAQFRPPPGFLSS